MKRLAIALMFLSQPALADEWDGYGHMMNGYGYGIGMMFGPVLWLIVLGLIVAGMIWFVRRMEGGKANNTNPALTELDLRFARGEIDADDYAARKKLLTT